MPVAVKASQEVDVTLSERTVHEITTDHISRKFGIYNSRGYYHKITDGKLILVQEHSAGSHSFVEEQVIREATETDKAVLHVLYCLERGAASV